MVRLLLIIPVTLVIAACATTPTAHLMAGADAVRVAKADPPKGYVMVGPITVADGHGCGGFGSKGSYANAITIARNKAFQMGGNYVQIYALTQPHLEGVCFDDSYTINGMVFRSP